MPVNTHELDEGTKDRLLSILDREKEALSQGEMEFLTARRMYLTEEEMERYGIGKEAPKAAKASKKAAAAADEGAE